METANTLFEILYQDDDLVAIDKPAGFFAHPPENSMFRVPRSRIVLSQLRAQINCYVYPIHRLDVPTSGILLWGKHSEAASALNKSFRDLEVTKTYYAVVRGHVSGNFLIDEDLESEHGGILMPSRTDFETVAKVELPFAVGKKYPTSRYSWVKCMPQTGRFHQIRRHLNRIAHPIVGDREHGDSHHNRFFSTTLGIDGLCLRAMQLELPHPRTREKLQIQAPMDAKWKRIESLFTNKSIVPSNHLNDAK